MGQFVNEYLLKDKKVLEEISRHQWIESEKAGRDIGFDRAAEEWLVKFSKEWMDYHLPKQKPAVPKAKSMAKGAEKRTSKVSAAKKSAARAKK